ncbi:DUF1758 domain-containing protein [Trichonephila clavipes]|nr:DUF1758 domain-containing protein [Trichonephila clavipes]
MPLSRMLNSTFAMPNIIDSQDMGLRTVLQSRRPKDLRLDTALNEMLCDAQEFTDEIDIPANFELIQPRHRVRRRNVNFDYEALENPIEDPTLKYKAEFYFFTLDKAINALESREWESMKIIERVPEIELNNKCHYLPHRPVIKLNSQATKVRPVFDASASQRGKLSLNECLHKGINLLERIPDILDRFRMFSIGISADIEKAFLMLSVAPKDRDFLRFFSRNLWKLKISWDHELPPNCKKEFLAWFKDTSVLKNVNIPRHLKVNISSELHVFVDAVGGAYAACVFVRSIIGSKVNIVLARAKSRVAPFKPLSIPRLELMACNVGVRLVNSLMKALIFPNLKITFWSDSTTALWWIKEQGNWSVFVSNRVKEIQLLTKTHSWKHVPGNMNPADLLSRGCSPHKLLKSKWWEGPAWLKENPENWPTGEIIDQPSEIEVERRKIKIVNIDLENDAPLLWHLHNVSNYSKMIKVFGWILRFIYNCRKPCDKCTEPELSFYEIESSERCLIRLNQKCYLSEIKLLKFGIHL